jgi:hypothetical protein
MGQDRVAVSTDMYGIRTFNTGGEKAQLDSLAFPT